MLQDFLSHQVVRDPTTSVPLGTFQYVPRGSSLAGHTGTLSRPLVSGHGAPYAGETTRPSRDSC